MTIGSWLVGGASPFLATQPQGRTLQLTQRFLLAGSAIKPLVGMGLLCAVLVALSFACAGSLPLPRQEELVRRVEPPGPAPSRESDFKSLPPEVKKVVVKVSKSQNQTRFLLGQHLGIIVSCCIPWPQSELYPLVSEWTYTNLLASERNFTDCFVLQWNLK